VLRDGPSGTGTTLWILNFAVPASTGQLGPNTAGLCGLNLVGSPNTAMTLEFTAGVASVTENITLTGFDIQ
jgi:hypothetical protein